MYAAISGAGGILTDCAEGRSIAVDVVQVAWITSGRVTCAHSCASMTVGSTFCKVYQTKYCDIQEEAIYNCTNVITRWAGRGHCFEQDSKTFHPLSRISKHSSLKIKIRVILELR